MTATLTTPSRLTSGLDDLLDQWRVPYQTHAALGPLTWYGVGGHAEALARPESLEELAKVAQACRERGIPLRVLGSGANLLVREGIVPGVVVRLDAGAFRGVRVEGSRVTVGAGHDLFRLVQLAARRGLGGLERVAGIPASVGGAVRMNAGGAWGDLGQLLSSVTILRPASGEVETLPREAIGLSYRRTSLGDAVVVEATLDLEPTDPARATARVKEVFAKKKASQPMADRSAGCAFKNPPPDAPHVEGRAAGKLIDEAGLKGFRLGSAYVSPVHANFVAADREGARADDVWAVMEHVRRTVRERLGVTLEREVVVWP